VALIWRGRPAPQLHSKDFPVVSTVGELLVR
jgi:hypothetical protein